MVFLSFLFILFVIFFEVFLHVSLGFWFFSIPPFPFFFLFGIGFVFLLFFLISGLNRNAVKIAVYLLNKYEYYTDQNDRYYNFTLRELTTILGYAESSSTRGRVNPMIKKVLKWLCLAGVINIKEGYYNSRPCYYLTYCATREDNLKPQSLDELNFLEG